MKSIRRRFLGQNWVNFMQYKSMIKRWSDAFKKINEILLLLIMLVKIFEKFSYELQCVELC